MVFFFKGYRGHLDLHVLPHSFPTRRSSDLPMSPGCVGPSRRSLFLAPLHGASSRQSNGFPVPRRAQSLHRRVHHGRRWLLRRSEEHTSELQSLMRISYAVFCLKKKNIHKHNIYTYIHYCLYSTLLSI